jgi:hypothetical protein
LKQPLSADFRLFGGGADFVLTKQAITPGVPKLFTFNVSCGLCALKMNRKCKEINL